MGPTAEEGGVHLNLYEEEAVEDFCVAPEEQRDIAVERMLLEATPSAPTAAGVKAPAVVTQAEGQEERAPRKGAAMVPVKVLAPRLYNSTTCSMPGV